MSQNYEPEFKHKIVRLHLEEGRTIASLASEYEISKSAISIWGSLLIMLKRKRSGS